MPTTTSEPKNGAEAAAVGGTNGTNGNGFEEPNPFVQPGVPEKRQHTATVYYLDATKNNFHIHKNSDGQDLFDMVANRLRLVERDYFSLSFVNEKTSEREWLYNDQRISKQVGGRQWEFTFEFKFYPPEPSSLVDDLARRHLMLQCRRDICSGRVPTSFATQALLASYLAQAELGDYAPSEQYVDYLRSANVAPSVDDKLISKIQELHHQHRGQTPSEAEINYLNTCKKLNMYGIYGFEGKDKGNQVLVGIGAHGVNIYKDNVRLHRFPWQHIDKISYKNQNFIVKLKPETVEKGGDKHHSTRMADYHVAKKAWKTAVEHHTFFRLIQPEAKPRKSLFRWNSQRFRYQGRTQFQTKMASQMFDHTSARPNDSGRQTSRSVDDIAQHAKPISTSPVRYVDDRTETRTPLSSPDQSYLISTATEEGTRKSKKKDEEEVGVRRLDYASSVPVSSSAENLHASSSSRRPQAHTTAFTATNCHLAPSHDHLQPFLRDQELDGTPMSDMVSVYNKGFYEGHKGVDSPSMFWAFWRRQKSPDAARSSHSGRAHHRHLNGTSSHRTDATVRNDELPTYPIRYFSSVYHSGASQPPKANRRFEFFEREFHPGTSDVVEKADLDQNNYLFAKTERSGDTRLDKVPEVDSCPLLSTTRAYHSGKPPHRHRAVKHPRSSGIATDYIEDDTTSGSSVPSDENVDGTPKKMAILHLKKPAKRRRGFGLWRSKESEVEHDTEPSTSKGFPIARDPYVGPIYDTQKDDEFVPNPLRDDVQVYHSGRSRAPVGNRKKSQRFARETHLGIEEVVDKENIDWNAYRAHSDAYHGHLDETSRRRDMETMPIKEFASIYHPGQSRIRRKTKRKRRTSVDSESSEESVEDEEFTSPGRRGTNFFKFFRSTANRGYPEKSVFSGKLHKTAKDRDLVEDPLRYSVAVYHSGYSSRPHWYGKSRIVHEGDEDFVDKNNLRTEFYPTGGKSYEGPLERLDKNEDLKGRRLREFANVYHLGYSYEEPSKGFLKGRRLFRGKSASESDEETKKTVKIRAKNPVPVKEKEERKLFGKLRSSGRKESPSPAVSAFPAVGKKYAGPLDNTDKDKDMDSEPLRGKVAVYHSGYSLAPFGRTKFWSFERFKHPGEEETVEKEKVDAASYQRKVEPYAGPLESTEKNADLDTVPIRHHTKIYHPGFSHLKVKKSKGDRVKSDKESGFESDSTTESEGAKKKRKEKSLQKEEKNKRSGSFGLGIRFPKWKFGGSSNDKDAGYSMSREPFTGKLDDTNRSKEIENDLLRSQVSVYHTGYSVPPGWRSKKKSDRVFHSGDEEVVEKTRVKLEFYPMTKEEYSGHLKSTERENELESVPMQEHAKAYHPGHSFGLKLGKRKTSESSGTESDEERDRFEKKTPKQKKEMEKKDKRSGSFGLKFPSLKLPSWDRSPGKEHQKYRSDEEPYRGTIESTSKNEEIQASPLKDEVQVYHSGTPKRLVAEKKVRGVSKSYKLEEENNQKTPTEVYRRIGENENTTKSPETTPFKERPKSPRNDDEEGRRGSFRFGIKMPHWKFGGKHGEHDGSVRYPDYPHSEKYVGPLHDVSKNDELNPEPIRNHSNVYHSGYSIRPGHPSFFDRWFHPGEEEVVDKEKIDLGPYKKSSEPYTGSVNETKRGNDFDTVPIRGFANVYHPGRSDIKVKKSKKTRETTDESEPNSEDEVEEKKEKTPSKSGKGFGFNFKLPSWRRNKRSDYPTFEQYSGPMDDVSRSGELQPSPLRENVSVYHFGRPHKGYDLFIRTSHPGEEETIEKEKVKLESYQRSAMPYVGPVDETHKAADLDLALLKQYSRAYHSGYSSKEPGKWRFSMRSTSAASEDDLNRTFDSVDSVGSSGSSRFGKLKFWRTPDKSSKEAPEPFHPIGFPTNQPHFTGALDSTEKSSELDSGRLRDVVAVYHSGYSESHRPNRKYLMFGRWRHEGEEEVVDKEKVHHESYKRSVEPYAGPLESTSKSEDLAAEPIRRYAAVYHAGKSYIRKSKREKKRRISEVSESSSEEDEPRRVGFHKEPVVVKPSKSLKKTPKEEKKKEEPGEDKKAKSVVIHVKTPSPKKEGKEGKEVVETPKRTKTKSSRRSAGLFGFWRGSARGESPSKQPKTNPKTYYSISEVYSGPLDNTQKWAELGKAPLRSAVDVYHSGQSVGKKSARFAHPGDVDVIEKNLVKPDSYKRSKQPFEGPLDSMQKSSDLENAPLQQHSNVYHDGHSYTKTRQVHKRTASEASYTSTEDAPQAKKHALKLPDTSGDKPDKKTKAKKDKKKKHKKKKKQRKFRRVAHPGKVETVKKEKVKPETYKRSLNPYVGPLDMVQRDVFFETEPIRQYADVYHPGTSDGKQERKLVVHMKSPMRVEENGTAAERPSSSRRRLFSRDAPDQKEETVEKNKINLSKYPVTEKRSTPAIVVSLDPSGEISEAPIREHSKVYHSGQSIAKKPDEIVRVKPGYNSESPSTSGVESVDEGSPSKKRRLAKRPKRGWSFREFFRLPRKVDYTYPMITAPYQGPVDTLGYRPEIGLLPIPKPGTSLESARWEVSDLPRSPSPFSFIVNEVTLNVFVQNERISDYHCEVIVGPWPESEREGPGGAGLRGMIGFEEARRAAEVDFVPSEVAATARTQQPATMESAVNGAPEGRSLFASIRRQLSQVTKKKDKKEKKAKKEKKDKKKAKKGVDVDSTSVTSSDSTDVEVVHREIVVPNEDKENVTTSAVHSSPPVTTNNEPEDKTTPSGPYVAPNDKDGIVVREEKLEEVYRITGTGTTPNMDPSDTSLAGTVAQYIKEHNRTPGVQLMEKNVTVRELPGQLPAKIGEGSLPHTTIQSWHETAIGPESVTTDVDEHGNVVKRTVKTQQVKHTVQRQTYQTFTVNNEETGTGHIETSRQIITPVGGNGTSISPAKSPVVETHTRTVAYENPTSEMPNDVPGEFVSSKTVTQGNRTVETITYKTEKDGVIETHVEHRVTIHSGSDIDHDAELSQAILEATNMNPDMTVERIEVKQESQC